MVRAKCRREAAMGWRDFRDFLAELERRGMVRHVAGADPDLEIGTLVELMCERMGPMLLFDEIKGFPLGYRIAGKPYATPARAAVALGLDATQPPLALVKAWKEKAAAYRPIPPVAVSSGVVLQNVAEDDAVDLTRFPIPRWHEATAAATWAPAARSSRATPTRAGSTPAP